MLAVLRQAFTMALLDACEPAKRSTASRARFVQALPFERSERFQTPRYHFRYLNRQTRHWNLLIDYRQIAIETGESIHPSKGLYNW